MQPRDDFVSYAILRRLIRHCDSPAFAGIEFTMNGDEVVLVASPKDVDLIAN